MPTYKRWVVALVLTGGLGCGGARAGGAGARLDPGGGASGGAQAVEAGLPAWTSRGSVAVETDGKRVFYGVGAASGIKNPALLRQTADNRARNELAKVFETFSASLMKDYANSDGEQSVENAVKTFTSMSLEGVQVVDRYIGGDGTMWALAALDIEGVMAAIQKAKAEGIVKTDVKPVAVDDIFDQHAKKAPPPAPPHVVAQGGADSNTPPAPAEATSGAQVASGEKPAWVEGADPRFPNSQYLCAVGFGPERNYAENGAYAALAKIFVAYVESASRDFMGAYSKTGAASLDVQSSETLTKTTTQKLFSGVRIPEVWQGDGTIYALACLERGPAAARLQEQIEAADSAAGRYMNEASAADKTGRLRKLSAALDSLVTREALNNELRIVDASGVGIPSNYSHADVAAALEGAVEALSVGVQADGPYADDFRGALVDALTKRGYKIADGNDGLDVLVSAVIRMEDGGAGTGRAANMKFARGVIQIELKDVAAGKLIGSLSDSRKEGHRSREEAERRVVRELAKKLSTKVGGKIDDAMKGKR